MRYLDIQRPTLHTEVPKCDLGLILEKLRNYHMIATAGLCSIAYTTFLFGLAVTRRTSELHALMSNVFFNADGSQATLQVQPSSLLKHRIRVTPSRLLQN